ncbi:MAG: response regulator [Candidatus Adiutrix sp.]|jgi:signal transduction histidine kinase/CheY-like chemotaxis protein|nr:response regulator [Candidatus Adiutrix sp.]
MVIRAKIASAIILIAIPIIIFGIGAGLVFVQGHLEKTIENDMAAVAEIADRLITTEIDLLKADASAVARRVHEASAGDLERVLREQAEAYEKFVGLTVIDRSGLVAAYGPSPTPAALADSVYVRKAFSGEMVISTSREDQIRELVFHVCVPVEDGRVLSATIPGRFFSDIVSQFTIWQTGNIFILDAEGTVIANAPHDLALERYNAIERAKTDRRYQKIAETASRMIAGQPGSGKYAMYGKERLCVYRPITGSRAGWSLGVVAPLDESPLEDMRGGLHLVGIVCLLLSIIAAFFASRILERPYKTTNAMAETLKTQDKLLLAINDTAATLLTSKRINFERDLWRGLDRIAQCAGVDRMRVWRNHARDGELYCSQICEWSGGAEPQAGRKITQDVSYSLNIPGWEEKLSTGQCINGLVRTFSPAEQAQLSPQGIISILVIPVSFQERFWGFVVFDDCHRERIFSSDDENLLRSGGLLIVNAIRRNEMAHDLFVARDEAIASAEAKSDFLANMSHEMRTPLNAIIGLSELELDSEALAGLTRDNLEKIYNSGVTLLSLINDILDISKIESGKFEIIPVEYDTSSLINDTATLNIVRIGARPITFHLDIDENLPRALVGDELRVKQIFNNLLSNAFKYTREGRVDWRVSGEQKGDDVWLVSSIADTGLGIRPEDLEKLFSAYNQVDTKSNRKIGGTGLGLSICKNLVEMMGGQITVQSEYGKGSTFSVRIRQGQGSGGPIGAEVADDLRNFHYSENKRDRSAKLLVRARIPYARILVVDDVPTNLDVARGMMKPYGMKIDCVSSGPAAIDLIRNAQVTYNAVFMDHMMPGMDGLEATRIIREEIGTDYARTVPIIALTANAIVGNEDMFLQKGFQAFLPKPIDILRLDVIINRWVRDKELEKKLAIDGLDFNQGLARFGGDEDVYLDVLKSFALNTPPLLDQLRECRPEDLPNYAIVAHGIKSSSNSIGAEPVGSRAEALELAAKAGDWALVEAENNDFIEAVQTLLAGLSALLREIGEANPKPPKAEPDAAVLAALRQACQSFDIDEVDRAMKVLESYEYESRGDLVAWLRANVNAMGFKQIAERLVQE